jgi:hypothetical protein
MGRFMSPDWSAKYEPVPYAKLDNPQTLNLYAYVGNNPLSKVDADGHAMQDSDGNIHWLPNCICQQSGSAPPAPVLPPSPSGLGPGWKDVTPSQRPAQFPRRYQGPKGTQLEFDPADPNAPKGSYGAEDHWHEVDPATGKRTGDGPRNGHLAPGMPIPGPDGVPDQPEPENASERSAGAFRNAMGAVGGFISDHKAFFVGAAAVGVVAGAILLAPETGGASLGLLAVAP